MKTNTISQVVRSVAAIALIAIVVMPTIATASLLDGINVPSISTPYLTLPTVADIAASGDATVVSISSETKCEVGSNLDTVSYGGSVTVSWDTIGFDTIKLNGEVVVGDAGSVTFTNLTVNTTYTLEATNANGDNCTQSVTVACLAQVIPGCTDTTANNYNSSATEDDGSCTYPVDPVLGCTDTSATNYNSAATQDDGSCVRPTTPVLGCKDTLATNYNPSATEDDGSCVFDYPVMPACEFSAQTGRIIVDFSGEKLRTDQAAANAETSSKSVALTAGTYKVTLQSWDGYLNRVNTSQPNEQWKLHFLNNNTVIAASGYSSDLADNVSADGKTEVVNNNLDISTAITSVKGVHPYYPSTQFANSLYPICAAIDVVAGDSTPDPVPGCTDTTANNYNSSATEDDGSCTYPVDPVLGCTDTSATNYNSAATQDDGSCVRPTTTSGGGGGGSSSPRCELEVSDATISAGETVTLSWETSRATDIALTNDDGDVLVTTDEVLSSDKQDLLDSSFKVSPRKTTEYTLTAERGRRDRECTVEVEVKGNGGGGLTILETRDQLPLVSGISLTDVPYTGFEAGPMLTTLFYAVLTAWALYLTYVLVIPKMATSPVSARKFAPHPVDHMKKAEAIRPDAFAPLPAQSPVASVAASVAVAPSNLPVALAPVAPSSAAVVAQDMPVEVAAIEAIANNNQALLSSDAIKTFINVVPVADQLSKIFQVVEGAKSQFPLEDGWVVINNERMQNLLSA